MDDIDADYIYKIKFKHSDIYDIDCITDSRMNRKLSAEEQFHIVSSVIKKMDIPYELTNKKEGKTDEIRNN